MDAPLRLWWFFDEQDEMMPAGRESPEALFQAGGFDTLRPAPGPGDEADDLPLATHRWSVGETVHLACMDDLGRRTITFKPDGTFDAPADTPKGANHVAVPGDWERMGDSLEELASFEAENSGSLSPKPYEEYVAFLWWSGARFRIDAIKDGRPRLTCLEPAALVRPGQEAA